MHPVSKRPKKAAYEAPAIVTYTAGEILARLGPALANYCRNDC